MSDSEPTSQPSGGIPNPFWNREERRLRAGWRLLLQAILFVLLLGILQVTIVLVLAALPGGFDPSELGAFASPLLLAAGAVASLIAMVLSLLVAARLLDRRPLPDYGFHLGPRWWADLGFGLALGALLMAGLFLVEWLAGWVVVAGTFRTAGPGVDFAAGIIASLIAFICVGFYEEMFARGYQLRNLAEGLNLRRVSARTALLLAWAASSAIFGLLHAFNPNSTPLSTLNLMLVGLFLGLGFLLTGELAIPIGLHISWNFFQGNVFGFPVSGGAAGPSFLASQQGGPDLITGGAFGPEAGLLGLLSSLVGALLIWLWVRYRYGEARLQTDLAEYEPQGRRPAEGGGDQAA